MKRILASDIISGGFVFLFFSSALEKFTGFTKFVSILRKSPVIGSMAPYAGVIIPSVELLIAILLFIPRTRKIGLYATLGLMLTFTIYIAYMLMFAPHLPCGCGLFFATFTWQEHLWFNIGAILLNIIGIWLIGKKKNSNISSEQYTPASV